MRKTAQRTCEKRVGGVYELPVSLILFFREITKMMPPNGKVSVYSSSACKCETGPNVSLQSEGCLPDLDKQLENVTKMSTMAVVHKVGDLILHYILSEIVVHL